MKYIKIILLVLPIVGLISCVKQKDCDECESGIFEYLDEPITINPNCMDSEKKVVAIFRPVIGDIEIYDSTGIGKHIIGSIPSKYQTSELLKVKICAKNVSSKRRGETLSCLPLYKLKCIEKED
jgi:hypothetical protein